MWWRQVFESLDWVNGFRIRLTCRRKSEARKRRKKAHAVEGDGTGKVWATGLFDMSEKKTVTCLMPLNEKHANSVDYSRILTDRLVKLGMPKEVVSVSKDGIWYVRSGSLNAKTVDGAVRYTWTE